MPSVIIHEGNTLGAASLSCYLDNFTEIGSFREAYRFQRLHVKSSLAKSVQWTSRSCGTFVFSSWSIAPGTFPLKRVKYNANLVNHPALCAHKILNRKFSYRMFPVWTNYEVRKLNKKVEKIATLICKKTRAKFSEDLLEDFWKTKMRHGIQVHQNTFVWRFSIGE